ncbi:MAG TPA: NAD(P)-binding domain-containing protein [Labilithrix sp.]|jgi:3-hydroxyisobutyrate dehydrogenase
MIAWLGTGLLGSGFVRALRKRGEDVHVWNRTHARAAALEEHGARAFADVADAVRGASRVHVTLSDDAAVDEVLANARAGLAADAIVIDHTTTSVSGSVARAAAMRGRFLHAPVFMGPQNALESTGLMLASGDEALFARTKPALEPMTGKLHWLGAKSDRAIAFKLIGNMYLMFLQAGFADMLAFAKAVGVPASEAATLLDLFNPGASAPARLKRMIDAQYQPPSWQLAMARKDARLMGEEGGAALTVLPAIAARMDAMLARGHRDDDWSVLGKDSLG